MRQGAEGATAEDRLRGSSVIWGKTVHRKTQTPSLLLDLKYRVFMSAEHLSLRIVYAGRLQVILLPQAWLRLCHAEAACQ